MSKQFHDFGSQWGFKHATSTPRYLQSNGKSEATVKSMKKLIRTSWRGRSVDEDVLTRALLQYRNTPSRKDGLAPAQKLYGTPVQDRLPAHTGPSPMCGRRECLMRREAHWRIRKEL